MWPLLILVSTSRFLPGLKWWMVALEISHELVVGESRFLPSVGMTKFKFYGKAEFRQGVAKASRFE
jgi:hypothetical protein